MKKILFSLMTIAVVALVGVAGTSAYFSDTETSTDNTFVAGSIDLQLSNEAYYNGNPMDDFNWDMGDIGPTTKFFDYEDVKPGDWGYNHVSAKVVDNDAWAKATITKTADKDNNCTEPETEVSPSVDPQCAGQAPGYIPPSDTNGELDEAIFAMVWDDVNENGIKDAAETLYFASNSNQDTGWSSNAPFNPFSANGQMVGNQTYTATLGWCAGLPAHVSSGNDGVTNTVALQGVEVDLSTCDGSVVDNRSQSDSLVLDLAFEVTQQRHQSDPY